MTFMKNLANALENAMENVAEVKTEPELGTVHVIRIYKFGYDTEGNFVIRFTENGTRGFAIAHPALRVSPLMKTDITAVISEKPWNEGGWELVCPRPTPEQIAEYNAKRAQVTVERTKVELTPEDQAYLASFRR
jgi:hypothetical protein